jgi:broad-specificity NMP kinase
VIIDAHWAHEIPGVNTVIVLRLRPRELRQRLVKRRWPAAKVAENVEAEGIGIILSETAKRLPRERIAELDVTGSTAQEIVDRLLAFITHPDPERSGMTIGSVDWSPDFNEWSSSAPRSGVAAGAPPRST